MKWEYLALNVKKVPGMATEDQFNKRGAEGWADTYSHVMSDGEEVEYASLF